MKIDITHYCQLKSKYEQYVKQHNINPVNALNSMRLRWDIYWACGGAFTNTQEYQYLNDNHIDTAIRTILKDMI